VRECVRTWEHGRTTSQHDIGVKVLAQIEVASVDSIDDALLHARVLLANKVGMEQDLGRAEGLRADVDRAAVGQAVLDQLVGLGLGLEAILLLGRIAGDVAHGLLDVFDDLLLGRRVQVDSVAAATQ